LNSSEAQKRVAALSALLHKHNHAYYVLSAPTISDMEFDTMLKELESLEAEFAELASPNSPTKRVGGDITDKFEKIPHDFPMLSLSNSYSIDEIREFDERVKKVIESDFNYVCELKYDGVAISLKYQNGYLVRALTRGDGTVGENVIANARTINSIPIQLTGENYPADFEIRGEIFMPHAVFAKINEARAANGEELLANPRNTASGTMKMQDSAVVASRQLDCFLYGVYANEKLFKTHEESLKVAEKWGLKTPEWSKKRVAICQNIDAIADFINYWDEARKDLPFDIDGIVIKVNQYDAQEELGYTAKSPKWAIAYKFKAEKVCTQLNEVTYQVGRTGAITPVANLTAVHLGGTTIRRASLHNADQIEKLDLHECDFVFVEKGGEIIPKIVGVDVAQRKPDAKPVQFIEHCPDCNSELVRLEGEAQHYCLNDLECPTQIKGKLEHFVGRKAMNIDGFGAETVELLYQSNLIKNSADMYQLTYEQLIQLERMADKSVNKLLAGIEKSKEIPFEKVLFALGIRHVGETVAKKLAKQFRAIENIMNCTEGALAEVDEIGVKIAESLVKYFADVRNVENIERLKAKEVKFAIENTEEPTSSIFSGLSFVVSGVFNEFSRDELKSIIESNGGAVKGSISKNTSFVVAGENMGPSKLEKAEKLGVAILNEQEFISKLQTS
jgi:DNA ligase (NAD+)